MYYTLLKTSILKKTLRIDKIILIDTQYLLNPALLTVENKILVGLNAARLLTPGFIGVKTRNLFQSIHAKQNQNISLLLLLPFIKWVH